MGLGVTLFLEFPSSALSSMKKSVVMPFFCTYLPQYVSFVMPADICCCLEVQKISKISKDLLSCTKCFSVN